MKAFSFEPTFSPLNLQFMIDRLCVPETSATIYDRVNVVGQAKLLFLIIVVPVTLLSIETNAQPPVVDYDARERDALLEGRPDIAMGRIDRLQTGFRNRECGENFKGSGEDSNPVRGIGRQIGQDTGQIMRH